MINYRKIVTLIIFTVFLTASHYSYAQIKTETDNFNGFTELTSDYSTTFFDDDNYWHNVEISFYDSGRNGEKQFLYGDLCIFFNIGTDRKFDYFDAEIKFNNNQKEIIFVRNMQKSPVKYSSPWYMLNFFDPSICEYKNLFANATQIDIRLNYHNGNSIYQHIISIPPEILQEWKAISTAFQPEYIKYHELNGEIVKE